MCDEQKGIYYLAMLKELTKEAETNPEPWKAFEIKQENHDEYRKLRSGDQLHIFANPKCSIRRIPKKRKVAQHVFLDKKTGLFTIHGTLLTDNEVCSLLKMKPEWALVETYTPSTKEIDDV